MSLRIAILCNDKLALPALNALVSAGMVRAIAMPDRRSEARMVVQNLCAHYKVPIQYFTKAGFAGELKHWLKAYQPEVVLVKTFPWKIPVNVLTIPTHGFINFHYAPLPIWRGPNPLFWMIRYRVSMAGITVHRMDEQYDTGPILYQQAVPVQTDSTMGMLLTQLAWAGVQVTNYLLHAITTNTVTAIPQDNSQAGWYRRPQQADLVIDWNNMQATDIHALVKACNPWNKGAATSFNGWMFAITDATIIPVEEVRAGNEPPGTIVHLDPVNGMQIMCSDGQLLRADIIYCEEGFFAGYRLAQFGIKKNNCLGTRIQLTEHSKPILNI